MDKVTVTLTRAEHEALVSAARYRADLDGRIRDEARGPALGTLDLTDALNKLEAAGRVPLRVA